MKKIYFIKCKKYIKFKNKSYILDETLVLSIAYDKCDSSDEKYLKKINQLRY